MKRSWMVGRIASLAALLLAGSIYALPVSAENGDNVEDRQKNRPKNEPAGWSDPIVNGIVMQALWVESGDPNWMTAALIVWHTDSDMAVTIYGDDPSVRQAIVDGVACVGRYVVIGGDRLDAETMIGRSIQVPNLDMECTSTLQPL